MESLQNPSKSLHIIYVWYIFVLSRIIYMEQKISQIKRVKSYIATLREFAVGETKYYKPVDTDYTGFHNARKRLAERNEGKFALSWCDDKTYFKVIRLE